jgi:hypothetical protein
MLLAAGWMTFNIGLNEIGEAVAEVESGRMASFAKLLERATGEVSLLLINRHEGDLRLGVEQIEISNAVRAVAGFNDH